LRLLRFGNNIYFPKVLIPQFEVSSDRSVDSYVGIIISRTLSSTETKESSHY
jgi:hypothetical protein